MRPISVASLIVFIATVALHDADVRADESGPEAQIDVIANKVAKLEQLVSAGTCTTCSTSVAVLQHRLNELISEYHPGVSPREFGKRLLELNARLDELAKRLDSLPKVVAANVVTSLSAKYGDAWEAAARRAGNVCSAYVDALVGGTAAKDAQVTKALADAVDECVKQGRTDVEIVRIIGRNGGVLKTPTTTVVIDSPPKSSAQDAAPKAASKLDDDAWARPSPTPSSSRSLSGWALSGFGGAIVTGLVGWWVGNTIKPIVLTDSGIDAGGGPPGAAVGVLLGALTGALIYAELTAEK